MLFVVCRFDPVPFAPYALCSQCALCKLTFASDAEANKWMHIKLLMTYFIRNNGKCAFGIPLWALVLALSTFNYTYLLLAFCEPLPLASTIHKRTNGWMSDSCALEANAQTEVFLFIGNNFNIDPMWLWCTSIGPFRNINFSIIFEITNLIWRRWNGNNISTLLFPTIWLNVIAIYSFWSIQCTTCLFGRHQHHDSITFEWRRILKTFALKSRNCTCWFHFKMQHNSRPRHQATTPASEPELKTKRTFAAKHAVPHWMVDASPLYYSLCRCS